MSSPSRTGARDMTFRNMLDFEFRKTLPQEFGGGRIRVTARADRRVLKPGWKGAAQDLQLVARNLVKPGMTVWDIGANLGIFSFMSAGRAGPSGRVYALEADPKYADLIARSSLGLDAAYAPVTVLCAAIDAEAGLRDFGISARGHARNRLVEAGTEAGGELASIRTVVALSGDSLLSNWRAPDVLKIDVEGAELAALAGCHRILSKVRPVCYIEIADENSKAAGALLKEHGYDLFKLKGDGSEELIEDGCFYTIARPR